MRKFALLFLALCMLMWTSDNAQAAQSGEERIARGFQPSSAAKPSSSSKVTPQSQVQEVPNQSTPTQSTMPTDHTPVPTRAALPVVKTETHEGKVKVFSVAGKEYYEIKGISGIVRIDGH